MNETVVRIVGVTFDSEARAIGSDIYLVVRRRTNWCGPGSKGASNAETDQTIRLIRLPHRSSRIH